MDTFQPPPPPQFLPPPDLVSTSIPAPLAEPQIMTNCYQKQQVGPHTGMPAPCAEPNQLHPMVPGSTMLPPCDDTGVTQLMMDCSMDANNDSCPSNNQTGAWVQATPSSSASFGDCTGFQQQSHLLPPPPSPPEHHHQQMIIQPPQLPDIVPSKIIEEFEIIMGNENDKVVLTNSICLLYRFSIDGPRGHEVCKAMSTSSIIMNRLYYVLQNEQFNGDDLISCYAAGNLTNVSKYDEGRAAILGAYDQCPYGPSDGVQSLIRSLQSKDSNVVIFAITAIHNLLLDRRVELQEMAKEQVKYGLQEIVKLLENVSLGHNYEFKVIVLDCLQILAYGNSQNRLAIKKSGGPSLLLRTIEENFNHQPTEELIETASRVLKSLSACPENKVDIIHHGGIKVLTSCIKRENPEILKTCLWTLRNLSDLINNSQGHQGAYINQLVGRLLTILDEYSDDSCIITCALGILANLTCNNEPLKQFICMNKGVELLLRNINEAINCARYPMFDRDVLREMLEPAIFTLCHLMNQNHNPNLAQETKNHVNHHIDMLHNVTIICEDLSKTVEKMLNIASSKTYSTLS